MPKRIPVWATQIPSKNSSKPYQYRYYHGQRQEESARYVGFFERGHNPETGEKTGYNYYQVTNETCFPQPPWEWLNRNTPREDQ